MEIVNDSLSLISRSYFEVKNISKDWHLSFDNLIKQNVVSGCAMMVNRALLEKAFPLPDSAYMHDWWLAIIASLEGEVLFIDKPLTLYRQHANNTIGAGVLNRNAIRNRLKKFFISVDKTVEQAIAIANIKPSLVNESPTLKAMVTIRENSRSKNVREVLNGNLKRSSLLGTIAMIAYCTISRKL